jgi:hypothetical protein
MNKWFQTHDRLKFETLYSELKLDLKDKDICFFESSTKRKMIGQELTTLPASMQIPLLQQEMNLGTQKLSVLFPLILNLAI